MTTAQSLVENVLQLISLPEIYLRLQQVIDDPDHTREQVAEIVGYDPSLSARVLRIANSSYYSFPREIETVGSAVGIIGELVAEIVGYDPSLSARVLRIANSSYYSFPREIETVGSAVGIIGELDLRNLVLAASVVGSMNALNYRAVDIDEFWLHSLRCGITARQLARSAGGFNPEILFLAGMLHDLGILVIYQQDAELAGAIARQIEDKHQLRDQAEREVLGFDHAEVGALLLEAWDLPRELAGLARCHHQYQLAQDNEQAALMLAMANLITETGASVDIDSDPRLAAMLEQLDMDQDTLKEIVDISDRQAAEVRNIVLG